MKNINTVLLNHVIEKSRVSPRKRLNYNFHSGADDTLQRMLNALNRDTYVQPHKHENPDKREVFIILTGRAVVFEFTLQGDISEYTILDNRNGIFGCEISPGTYHTIFALEDGTVVYELKDGPYNPLDDKNFASWAPKEGEAGTHEFKQKLLKYANLA